LKTDVRVIAATHHNLKQLVVAGGFRADLYYRLNILNLHIPSLRERMEDFEDLLYFFAREMRVSFSVDAINKLKEHRWPGNIRELKNAVARARALCQGKVEEGNVDQIIDRLPTFKDVPQPPQNNTECPNRMGNVLKDIERTVIEKRLVANMGNQRQTALDLGLPKSTLHDRIKAYDIDISALLANSINDF
ncbi:MAG: sigma-54-dependent Fis family transcriptional regulator, partial [Bdellovibrionales bacterium]|nr:sigma-54-dependent Fis family transcriptional regulator [Bdellovibrionales bacterium]